jgi:hypothetical protein
MVTAGTAGTVPVVRREPRVLVVVRMMVVMMMWMMVWHDRFPIS